MSARGAMTMRAQVSRMQPAPTDPYGQKGVGAFADIGVPIPCRSWSKTRRQVLADGKEVVVEDIRAQVPAGSDVQTDDRLVISNRLGATLYGGPLAVNTVTRRGSSASNPGHLELMLTRHLQGPN